MRSCFFTLSLTAIGFATTSHAVPISALSYLQVDHGFVVDGGETPVGISAKMGGPTIPHGVNSAIDDPLATNSTDSDTTVGCACDPPIPYETFSLDRTNRTDPTEFAQARYDVERLFLQDGNATFFAVGEIDTSRSGLAQARITSGPVAASAFSEYGTERIQTFENISGQTLSFNIRGSFAASLIARYSGADGFARTTTSIDLMFSGLDASDLIYLPLQTYAPDIEDAASGASVTEGLFVNAGGALGMSFTGSTTAVGDGGFTEATLDADFEYFFRLTLDPGQTVSMRIGFSQTNAVDYTPVALSAVPVPAPALLLLTGLGSLIGLRRRRTV